MGLPGVRYKAWEKVQQSVYGLNKDTYKAVDALLESLRLIEKVADFNNVDVSDAALDIWNHPKTTADTRAAAQIILEASPNAGK